MLSSSDDVGPLFNFELAYMESSKQVNVFMALESTSNDTQVDKKKTEFDD